MTYDIDPELVPMLEFLPVLALEDPVAARAGFDEMTVMMNAELDESGVEIENLLISGPEGAPEVAIRVYSPQDKAEIVPALLYIHGGGFVIGSLDTEHGSALALCRDLGIVVVSVGYRKAPETPFPGPLEDCYAALVWTSENAAKLGIDLDRLGIFGQSAGGGLSAATALLSRDRKGPKLCFQYLGIPEVDDRLETPSMKKFIDTPLWNRPAAELSWDYYLGDAFARGSKDVPYLAAPARAEDLSNLPPAHVTTMEFDPLRDEGVLYALKLMQAGVSVELHSYPKTFHGSSLVMHAAVSKRQAEETNLVLRRGLKITDA
ncbi:MAG: acetyl esterase [Halioglobus sp.]|jgi:acetyl esterase